jgi:hypothetical protein
MGCMESCFGMHKTHTLVYFMMPCYRRQCCHLVYYCCSPMLENTLTITQTFLMVLHVYINKVWGRPEDGVKSLFHPAIDNSEDGDTVSSNTVRVEHNNHVFFCL